MAAVKPRERKRELWHPAEYEDADIGALQSLWRGTASPEQQRRGLEWVMYKAAAMNDLSFFPDNSRVTDFQEGRRYVGLQVAKLLAMIIGARAKGDG